MEFCKYCGHQLEENAIICANCKKVIGRTTEFETQQAVSQQRLTGTVEAADNKPNDSKSNTSAFEPIHTQSNGFYRYNHEKEQLEFINHQTKIVTGIWNIPKDQWQALPDKEDLCRRLTAEANAAIEKDKMLTIRGISAAASVVAAILSIALLYEALGWPNFPAYIYIGGPILFWVIFYNIICKIIKSLTKQ